MTPDEYYLKQVKEYNASGSNIVKDTSDVYETYSLSPCEIEVFDIDPKLQWLLSAAYTRYEAMNNLIVDGMFDKYAEQDRKDWPQFYTTGETDFLKAATFMKEACGLSYQQSWAWVIKEEFSHWRLGRYPDEASTSTQREIDYCMPYEELKKKT